MSKKSIRFFNDRKVRAVWDEEHNKWWFSATDIVRAINNEEDYTKCRNYWKYLKGKFHKENIEVVSITNHFKFRQVSPSRIFYSFRTRRIVNYFVPLQHVTKHPIQIAR
jgi:prophage antirepressor-like protein